MSKFTEAAKHLDSFVQMHESLQVVKEVLADRGTVEVQVAEQKKTLETLKAQSVSERKKVEVMQSTIAKAEAAVAASHKAATDMRSEGDMYRALGKADGEREVADAKAKGADLLKAAKEVVAVEEAKAKNARDEVRTAEEAVENFKSELAKLKAKLGA
jgi:hypothetical protein